jgi:hypothetical protein
VTVVLHDRQAPNGVRPWIELMAPAAELAKVIAATEFVPKAMRHNPAVITAAILHGDEVGLGPMQSLAKIRMIDGQPTIAAEAQRALILARGHKLWPEEYTTTRVTWAGRRVDDDVTARVTWTMDNARTAGLAGRPSWRAYPRAMLSARASAELARAIFADVIGGLLATEELEDAGLPPEAGDAGVAAIAPGSPAAPAAKRRRRPAVAAVATVSGGSEPPASPQPPLPGEEGQPSMSRAQRDRIMGLMRARGITERADRLAYASTVVGRELTSSSELTADEAQQVIDALDNDPAPEGNREE